ncbi:MAG TPA: hypothetical protein VMR46_00815 [Candidatus Paceibacterota bacterium]|nr:hypothetical protein [Candidatus Paceibacterota bacterium]
MPNSLRPGGGTEENSPAQSQLTGGGKQRTTEEHIQYLYDKTNEQEKEAGEILQQVRSAKDDIKDTKVIIVAAVVVLIVMVGTLEIMVLSNWQSTANTLLDKIDTLQAQSTSSTHK